MDESNQTGMALFQGKAIRRTWYLDGWWFVIADVIEVLSESKNPTAYLRAMRRRDEGLAKSWGDLVTPLPIQTSGGVQEVNCASRESIFRIIQSIPSSKAEAFKQWFAEVAGQRLDELENPELALERVRDTYRGLGYEETWIKRRLQSIDARKILTDEWYSRGVEKGLEYSILTAEIARETFGLNPGEHKQLKGLKRENLRDHMTRVELIFTALGEEATVESIHDRDAFGFHENREAAQAGGKAARMAREAFEQETGKRVVSPTNHKDQIKSPGRSSVGN